MKGASVILGVSVRRLQIWDKEGKIRCVRTVGGRRRIPESEIKHVLGIKEMGVSKKTVIYVGVSSHNKKQRGGLEGQKGSLLEYAKSRGYEVVSVLRMLPAA